MRRSKDYGHVSLYVQDGKLVWTLESFAVQEHIETDEARFSEL